MPKPCRSSMKFREKLEEAEPVNLPLVTLVKNVGVFVDNTSKAYLQARKEEKRGGRGD